MQEIAVRGEGSRHAGGVKLADGSFIPADAVILAAGGASYPGTGSTGDGYVMAEKLGHTIQPIYPALVPLKTKEEWVKEASGLSLRNVRAKLFDGEKLLGSEFGEMLITHFGVEADYLTLALCRSQVEEENAALGIDLKPAWMKSVSMPGCRDLDKYTRKSLRNALKDLLPSPHTCSLASGIPPERPAHQVTRRSASALTDAEGAASYCHRNPLLSAAIVTQGGITLRSGSRTMASRLVGPVSC